MSGWLVTGASGQLGSDVVDVLHADGEHVTGLNRAGLDLTDPAAVSDAFAEVRPSIVVNCAAYTAVDAAETDEDAAHAVNATGPAHLAKQCAGSGARLIHVSTDYVFAGDARTPYDEQTPPRPTTAYGRTKAAGEQAVLTSGADAFVVRTAWLYGVHGPNFVKTMTQLAREHETVGVVDDQIGSPTWTRQLADGLVALGRSHERPGIWHCTNAGETSWYTFAQAIYVELGLDPTRVHPTTTAAFPRPAQRPAYSVLGTAKWQRAELPSMSGWREALHYAFATSQGEIGIGP